MISAWGVDHGDEVSKALGLRQGVTGLARNTKRAYSASRRDGSNRATAAAGAAQYLREASPYVASGVRSTYAGRATRAATNRKVQVGAGATVAAGAGTGIALRRKEKK
jgi:hypothetical protein